MSIFKSNNVEEVTSQGTIKVLGTGCKSCKRQLENVQTAVQEINANFKVEYITDFEKIASYGIMSMPAVVVNEKLVSYGKILSSKEVKDLLLK